VGGVIFAVVRKVTLHKLLVNMFFYRLYVIAIHYTVKSNRLEIFNIVIHSRLNLHILDY